MTSGSSMQRSDVSATTRIAVEAIQVQVAVLRIALQKTLPFQIAGHTMGDPVKQCLEFIGGGRRGLPETQLSFRRLDIDAVQAEHVEMDIEQQPH